MKAFTRRRSLSFFFTILYLGTAQLLFAADLPAGGEITAGSGSISVSGDTLTVTQHSAKLAADWQSFSIGAGHTVNFVQPSSDAAALNRVLGADVSVIQGSLNANGRVFLINPNGVLFTPGAQVNAGALVASTLHLSTEDFMAGKYSFEGNSAASVINRGSIRAEAGGTVALIAAKIVNEGSITAERGSVVMGAGGSVTLDLGGPALLEVNEGALETLIEQGGAIRADGGRIYLTTRAAGELSSSVINHTGVTEAKTLVTGEKGEIILLGDLSSGLSRVSGTLDASAPNGGDGGFIETSAAEVDLLEGLEITAASVFGKGGTWLIDPTNYTIDATAAGNIAGTLNSGTNVTVTTAANNAGQGADGDGNGDITVASAIAKTAGADASLSLIAANVIVLNAPITSTAGKLHLNLDADNDGGTRDGGGVIIATKGVSLNGGDLNFGTGAEIDINGEDTLVGGDLYIGGTELVEFKTGGGNINLYGELIIANEEGVNFTTNNGDAHFYGIINSGNKYEKITDAGGYQWSEAFDEAKNGTAGGSAVGDQYLATVTSRLENAVVVYTGGFEAGAELGDGSWLGGRRVTGIGTDSIWRWVAGPEADMDGGKGMPFNDGAASVSPVDGAFNNWQDGEPNNCCAGEDRLQIGDSQGRWNDLPDNAGGLNQKIYIRETNFDEANLIIDAGTGTVTFDEDIGTLKSINYTAYDNTNPNPDNVVTTAPEPPPSSLPKQNAVAAAQSGSSAKGVSNTTPPGFSALPVQGAQVPAGGGQQTSGSAGFMEIIDVSSGDLITSTGSGTQSGPGLSDPTKLFVVDGGIHEPSDLSGGGREDGDA